MIGYQPVICRWVRFYEETPEPHRLILFIRGDGSFPGIGKGQGSFCTQVQREGGGVWRPRESDLWAYFPFPETKEIL